MWSAECGVGGRDLNRRQQRERSRGMHGATVFASIFYGFTDQMAAPILESTAITVSQDQPATTYGHHRNSNPR